MERVLVSRQPIFNADMREFGYELLYRSSSVDSAAFSDGDRATAEVILNAFEIGLGELVGKHLAFINFDRNFVKIAFLLDFPKQSDTPLTALLTIFGLPSRNCAFTSVDGSS